MNDNELKKVLFTLHLGKNAAAESKNDKLFEYYTDSIDIMLTEAGAIDRGQYNQTVFKTE